MRWVMTKPYASLAGHSLVIAESGACKEDTAAFLGVSSEATTQLVQLGEAFSDFDQHKAGVGHVDPTSMMVVTKNSRYAPQPDIAITAPHSAHQ